LGHVVSKERISVDPSKIQAVKDWPVPKSAIEVKSFIRLAGCYRRFVRDFSKITASLTKLTKKREKYVWTDEYTYTFEKLKNKLITTPILKTSAGIRGMVI